MHDRPATLLLPPLIGLLSALFLLLPTTARADVVKPALIEITARTDGRVSVEIRASIEALLTGINAKYKNTQDAPQAEAYDALRVLQAPALRYAFTSFEAQFLALVQLTADGKPVPLQIQRVKVPPPGYTKVPRISVITLVGQIPRNTQQLRLYYPARFGDSAVRVRQVDAAQEKWHWSEWQWVRTDEPTRPFSLAALFERRPTYQVVAEYITLGFEHILPKGLDHILFILGLYLFSTRLSPLLWQVTMFTAAHTITLGLAMAGVIELPARIVEPLIALSIAYIGIENILARRLATHRLALVFAFGLLHGMGFAGVLADFGMPEDAFALALISFNVGVELGQLAVIALAFVATGLWFARKSWYRQAIVIPGSLAIALFGAYWTLERLLII